jgi:tryptophanase
LPFKGEMDIAKLEKLLREPEQLDLPPEEVLRDIP